MAYIEFKDVSKIYTMGQTQIRALDHISFAVEKGELCVIVGPSGAGKTTLLNILGGMDTATEGTVLLDGRDISRLNNRQLTAYRRDDVGFVFQFYNLVQNLTARENVELASEICRDSLDPVRTLEGVGLKERMNNFPAQLSGGEQQRVAIARAMVNRPKLLMADEPTGNLDPSTSVGIMRLLDRINRQGTTVVMATHDDEIVDQMRKRVIELKAGEIVRDQARGVYGSDH